MFFRQEVFSSPDCFQVRAEIFRNSNGQSVGEFTTATDPISSGLQRFQFDAIEEVTTVDLVVGESEFSPNASVVEVRFLGYPSDA